MSADREPRRVGVEEELLLVDPRTGELTAVSERALRAVHRPAEVPAGEADDAVQRELFRQQIETATPPCRDLPELERALRQRRRMVGEAARSAGATAVAVATPVLAPRTQPVTGRDRYRRIRNEFGELSRQSLVCAMHVHTEIHDPEEGVAVIDRLRPWLPVLLALSANSPYWQGRDTGYASWRSQIWSRWPTSGPAEPFGDASGYRRTSDRLLAWGAALDEGMLYYDARLSAHGPTVEVRVPDVCTEVDDAVLVAALTRALVATSAAAAARGESPAAWRSDLLRGSTWRAARYGVAGHLVHPPQMRLAPAREVVSALVDHVAEELGRYGELDLVRERFDRLMARGNGAARQRAVFEGTGSLEAVVRDLCRRTERSWAQAGA